MSARSVWIYGKEGCPYTAAAREDYGQRGYQVEYFDVKKDIERLNEMLARNGDDRRVPTIVENDRVIIGFGGT
jgi:glutaredoxin